MASPTFLLPLPTEILVLIANELDADDYGALRLSCKTLEARLFTYFAQKFFTSKHFFRGYTSLSALRDISESRLSPYVKTVILGTELVPSDLHRWSQHASVDECLKAVADQRSFCASGWDRDLIFLSFSKLPNLEGVEVREFEGNSHPYSPPTSQPITQTKAGYGLRTLMDEFGIHDISAFQQFEFDEEEVGISCVQALLRSAASAKKPLKTFKIVYQRGGYRAIACDALHIPFFQKKDILPILSTIEELHLDVFQKRITPWPLVTGAGQVYDTIECDTYPLRAFLGYTSQLRRLTLRQLNHQERKDGFWDWIAADPTTVYKGPRDAARLTTPPPAPFAHLQELRLGLTKVPIKPLTGLVRKISPTLRKIFLTRVMLYNALPDTDQNGLATNLWKELFVVLVEACSDLDEIEIDMSFSRHLRQLSTAAVGEIPSTQAGRLVICQQDCHYEGKEIKMKLREELQTPDDSEKRDPSPFHIGIDPANEDSIAVYGMLSADLFDIVQANIYQDGGLVATETFIDNLFH